MTEEHIKEQISRAYAKAIAARAGIVLREYEGLDYGLDGRFSDVQYDTGRKRYVESGFGIDFQIKATTNILPKGNKLFYDLEVKNYKDLIKTKIGTPRILIIYSMPKQSEKWITVSDEDTVLKRCAWWCSLKGRDDTENEKKKRIEFPVSQKLTPDELRRLIECVKAGADL
ncbi:hypothetical protein OXPF_39270 [Oxobacter pfennigii]|uniref:DUF4365 domain-containing protein n=1 Tax=Oxobacter pfennigii TaxID=36849 RepID=A0A0P8W409_9CLOT|nr:DUF4365 domain-containing protein [Oxobacter pfennigii]KPU42148.1 hypothetical protein OXPF_39270 [Oxobacter pfennigii]